MFWFFVRIKKIVLINGMDNGVLIKIIVAYKL